jgi:D-glycero-D-manno-heptose 1,7-bisphosphate phosphatase
MSNEPKRKKALFLDRDGVVNVEKHYVYKTEDFEFMDGIFPLTKTAQDHGYLIVIVTNQSGIGRGYYTEDEFHNLTDWMTDQFLAEGITVEKVYHCPYHPTAGVGEYRQDHACRKPKPGMLLQAERELGLALDESIFIGDKASDMEAGKRAGIGELVHFDMTNSAGSDEAVVSFSTLDEIRRHLFQAS